MKGEMAMKPEEYDVVRLLQPLQQHNLPVGARGTVVMDYTKYSGTTKQDLPPAYEVEFMDSTGATIALDTVLEANLEVVWRKGIGWFPGFGPAIS